MAFCLRYHIPVGFLAGEWANSRSHGIMGFRLGNNFYGLRAIGNQDMMGYGIPTRVGATTLRPLFHRYQVAHGFQLLFAYAVHLHEFIDVLEVALLPVRNNFLCGLGSYPRQFLQF